MGTIGPHYGAQYSGAGAKTTFSYDTMDRPLLVTGPDTSADPAGERTHHQYDAAGRLTRLTTPRGMQTTASDKDFAVFYGYDALDRVTATTLNEVDGSGTIIKTRKTHFCYDAAGDLKWLTAPKAGLDSVDCAGATPPAYTRTFAYDDAHRLLSEKDPLGHIRSHTYDANGNVSTVTDEEGDVVTYTYDERNLLVRVKEPFDTSGSTVRYLRTLYEYDPVGNLKRLITPRAYDASSDKVTFSKYVTSYVYDELNRLVRVDLPTSSTYPEQQYVHRSYDASSNLASVSLTTTKADPALVTSAERTEFSYWDPGWIRIANDPANPRVFFDYTAEGWQASRTPGEAGVPDLTRRMLWSYYPDGLVKEVKDVGGQLTSYAYDANGNLTTASESSGLASASQTPLDVSASYDGFDQLVKTRQKKLNDANYRLTTYDYDLNGNVVERVDDGEETASGGLVTPGRRHAFSYDPADWITSHIDYGTDGGSSDDQRIRQTFSAVGLETERLVETWSGSAWQLKEKTTWSHFANGKLKTLQTTNAAGTVLQSHTLSYEDDSGRYINGHRTKDVYTLSSPDGNAPCQTSVCTAVYKYDPRERLVEERDGHGTTSTFALDPAGNVVTETTSSGGTSTTRSFSYVGQQLREVSEGGVVVKKLHYDPFGNLDCTTTATGTAGDCSPPEGATPSTRLLADFAYDYRTRLASARAFASSTVTDEASYRYDPLDRPVEQTERHGAGSPKTTLLSYVGLTGQVATEQQKDSAGSLLQTKSYSYDVRGHRIAMVRTPVAGTAERYTYGYDVHGSVSLLINQSGEATAAYGYRAYGSKDPALTKGDTSAADPLNPFRYTAKRLDTGSGTLDMGARRFGPDTGRFLQADLYHSALADLSLSVSALTQNRYALAAGNPLSFIEWDGHVFVPDGAGGGWPDPEPPPPPQPAPPTTPAPPSPEPGAPPCQMIPECFYGDGGGGTAPTEPPVEPPIPAPPPPPPAVPPAAPPGPDIQYLADTGPEHKPRYGNGCGPGDWRNKVIPDHWPTPFGPFDFVDACMRHDLCYGTWGTIRLRCDAGLRVGILDECNRKWWAGVISLGLLEQCGAAAHTYYGFVRKLGKRVFRENQYEKCPFVSSPGGPQMCLERIARRDD